MNPLFFSLILLGQPMDIDPVDTEEPVSQEEPTAKVNIQFDGDKVTIKDVVMDASEVAQIVLDYRTNKNAEDGRAKGFMWMAFLAAIFKFSLSALRMTSTFWKTRRGKTVMRLLTLAMGVGAFLTANMAAGMPWFDALVAGLSRPIAVAFHEYTVLIPALARRKEKAANG